MTTHFQNYCDYCDYNQSKYNNPPKYDDNSCDKPSSPRQCERPSWKYKDTSSHTNVCEKSSSCCSVKICEKTTSTCSVSQQCGKSSSRVNSRRQRERRISPITSKTRLVAGRTPSRCSMHNICQISSSQCSVKLVCDKSQSPCKHNSYEPSPCGRKYSTTSQSSMSRSRSKCGDLNQKSSTCKKTSSRCCHEHKSCPKTNSCSKSSCTEQRSSRHNVRHSHSKECCHTTRIEHSPSCCCLVCIEKQRTLLNRMSSRESVQALKKAVYPPCGVPPKPSHTLYKDVSCSSTCKTEPNPRSQSCQNYHNGFAFPDIFQNSDGSDQCARYLLRFCVLVSFIKLLSYCLTDGKEEIGV